MAASINDKFKKVSADDSYAVATTVKTARTVGGGTTLEAFDLSKWADATAVNFLTYRKTTDPVTNITTVTNRTGWTALVNTSSNTLTNLTIAPGYTDLGQQVGDYIEPVQMSKWANDLVDGILVTHNADGTLKSKVATLAKINGGSTAGVLTTTADGVVSAVPLIDYSYSATGVAAAGEFTNTVRKTYDITSIPVGHAFVVTAINLSTDGSGFKNISAIISYNSIDYRADNWGQYHNTASVSVPLKKISGQNSVVISFGGSASSQTQKSTLVQMN